MLDGIQGAMHSMRIFPKQTFSKQMTSKNHMIRLTWIISSSLTYYRQIDIEKNACGNAHLFTLLMMLGVKNSSLQKIHRSLKQM